MNIINYRTDMADERVDTYKRINNMTDIDGVKVTSKEEETFTTVIVEVINENGKQAINKEIGKYVTIEMKDITYIDEIAKQKIIQNLSDVIRELIDTKFKSVMIVGLGNSNITPDSLGPKVVSYINITRHYLRYAKELVTEKVNEISAISPGVLGTTGIETEEIIQAVADKVKPDLIIAIDSLASMSVNRVGKTIQLSNTGITPGQGVGNTRKGLNKETLNIPVVSIGVPTVVDFATITNDAIDKVVKETNEELINIHDSAQRYNKIAKVLDTENYIVTPKEIDEIIQKISEIIASGINIAI